MTDAELKALLKGVEAERGAVVTCRDPSALEMLLRLGNNDTNHGSISAIFQKGTASSSLHSSKSTAAQMLFVNERFARTLEGDVQSWLDPFKSATAAATAAPSSPTTVNAKGRKRGRADTESDESSFESDSDSD